MMSHVLAMSEKTKIMLILLFLLVLLVFVIVGYAGKLIKNIMKKQGEKMETIMHDVVITNVVNDKKQFKKLAIKLNRRQLFKDAKKPAIILFIAGICVGICAIIYSSFDLKFDFFSCNDGTLNQNGTGFTTLLYCWNFSAAQADKIKTEMNIFGMTIQFYWPPIVNIPHFSVQAIGSYICVPLILVGFIWFMVYVQAYLSRTISLFKLSDSIYKKKLKDYNAAKGVYENNQNNNNVN